MWIRTETGYGKEMNKELFSSAVVVVADGKVEIGREITIDAGLRWGWFLENLAVELRGSGKRGWRGGFEYRRMHGSHREAILGCGFVGEGCGKRWFGLDWCGFDLGRFCAGILVSTVCTGFGEVEEKWVKAFGRLA